MKTEFDAQFWDDRYRTASRVWSGDPNGHLVAEVSGLAPGTALDVGCGEGADAIWLAERGWQVTAVDISRVALERARAIELRFDVAQRIEWVQSDLVAAAPPHALYDLVSAQFMHLAPDPRNVLFGRLALAVKPRGMFLIVGHHPSDLQTAAPRPPLPELFYTAADVAALLEPNDWDIVVDAARERSISNRAGQNITIHDTVLVARRRV